MGFFDWLDAPKKKNGKTARKKVTYVIDGYVYRKPKGYRRPSGTNLEEWDEVMVSHLCVHSTGRQARMIDDEQWRPVFRDSEGRHYAVAWSHVKKEVRAR